MNDSRLFEMFIEWIYWNWTHLFPIDLFKRTAIRYSPSGNQNSLFMTYNHFPARIWLALSQTMKVYFMWHHVSTHVKHTEFGMNDFKSNSLYFIWLASKICIEKVTDSYIFSTSFLEIDQIILLCNRTDAIVEIFNRSKCIFDTHAIIVIAKMSLANLTLR